MSNAKKIPTPIRTESRICFGISYFATEEEADAFAEHVRERGDTYNGGWFHGMPCGRDRGFDRRNDEGERVEFAVTTA